MEPTITIRNKKTGETKSLTVTEARKMGFDDNFINEKLVGSAELNKNLSTMQQGGDITLKNKDITADQENKRLLGESGLRTLEQAIDIYKKDPSVLTKQLAPGKFASRDFDNALYNTIETLLKARTGAAASAEEVRGYMNSLAPNFGDSPEVVQQKIGNLSADLSAYARTEPKTYEVTQTQEQRVPKESRGLVGDMLSKIEKPVGDLAKGVAKPFQDLYKQAEGRSSQENALYSAFPILNIYNPLKKKEEGGGYNPAGADVATTVVGGMGAKGVIKGLGGLLSKAKSGLGSLSVKGAAQARMTATEAAEKAGIKIDPKAIIEKGNLAIQNATADELPYITKMLARDAERFAKKELKPTQALEILKRAGQKTFTKTGSVRSAASATYNQAVREGLREEFAKKAPQVLEETTKIANRLNRDKTAKKVLGGIGLGVPAVAGGNFLYDMLFGKSGN